MMYQKTCKKEKENIKLKKKRNLSQKIFIKKCTNYLEKKSYSYKDNLINWIILMRRILKHILNCLIQIISLLKNFYMGEIKDSNNYKNRQSGKAYQKNTTFLKMIPMIF